MLEKLVEHEVTRDARTLGGAPQQGRSGPPGEGGLGFFTGRGDSGGQKNALRGKEPLPKMSPSLT